MIGNWHIIEMEQCDLYIISLFFKLHFSRKMYVTSIEENGITLEI